MPSSIKPKKLGHLVLKVRDIHESVRFYTEVLGLEVSDWIEEQMVFLRCGSDHHDLGLFQLPDNSPDLNNISSEGSPGLEHFSYEVEDYREVERAISILQEKKIEIVQVKNWARNKIIREKYLYQLESTTRHYKQEMGVARSVKVTPVFYTTIDQYFDKISSE